MVAPFEGGKDIELQLLALLAEESGGRYSKPDSHEKHLKGEVQALYNDSSQWGKLKTILPEIRAGQKLQLVIAPNGDLTGNNLLINNLPTPLEIADIKFYKKQLLKWLHWLNLSQLNALLISLIVLITLSLLWLLYHYLFRKKYEAANDPIAVLISNGITHPLSTGINTIGFLSESDIKIDHPTVDRIHATIYCQEKGEIILTDLHSKNGSWVNGHMISESVAIDHNDIIQFGEWEAIFQLTPHRE